MRGCTVEYLDHAGSDLTIVNAARVSLGKWKDAIDAEDERLIRYLARNKHDSPFRHCSLTMRLRMPIFVERQFTKHRIGVEINSISGRYVQFDGTCFTPDVWRKGSESIKQGSLAESVEDADAVQQRYAEYINQSQATYEYLLACGVCKEQARMVLPLSLMTEMICTMSLQALFHFYNLRTSPHAQREIQWFAHQIGALAELYFPVSWNALVQYRMN